MTTSTPQPPTVLLIPLLMLAFGSLLMIYMILVEHEPGGIPLLLISIGAIWTYLINRKTKKSKQSR